MNEFNPTKKMCDSEKFSDSENGEEKSSWWRRICSLFCGSLCFRGGRAEEDGYQSLPTSVKTEQVTATPEVSAYDAENNCVGNQDNNDPLILCPDKTPADNVIKYYKQQDYWIVTKWPRFQRPKTLPGSHIKLLCSSSGERLVIGKGTYSQVSLGYHLHTGKLVVLKVFNKDSSNPILILNEASICIWLNKTSVTPYCYGVVSVKVSDSSPYLSLALVMEFIGNVRKKMALTLFDLIVSECKNRKTRSGRITREGWLSIALNIVKALYKIHCKGVIINDLKSDNILLYREPSRWCVYLCDFGFSVYKHDRLDGHFVGSKIGRCRHYAPELVAHSTCGELSDVYSYGILIQSIGRKFAIPELTSLATRCLQVKPELRPPVINIIIQLEKLQSRKVINGIIDRICCCR